MRVKHEFWDLLLKNPQNLSDEEIYDIREKYTECGKELIYKMASAKKILPFVAHVFMYLEIDKDYWSAIHDSFHDRNHVVIEILDKIFSAFEKNHCVSPCVTENFGVLLATNYCVSCFCSGDVDISADPSEYSKIKKTLEDIGLTCKKRKDYHASIQFDEFKCPDEWITNFYINISWQPVIREKSYTLDQRRVNEWLKKEREQGIRYSNTRIKVLSDEAIFLHSIYHLSAGHYYAASPGVRLLTEIDRIVSCCEINWNQIIEMSKTLKIEKRVYISLQLAKAVLDTPISEDILSSFSGSIFCDRLINSLYMKFGDRYKLQEPGGLIKRLYIDIISDNGNIISSTVHKLTYAIKHLTKRKNN